MIIPEFLRFYPGYTLSKVMGEYAVSFFTLVNSMYRLKASESIDRISSVAVGMAESSQREHLIKQLEKSSKGISGILEEVRIVKP